MLKKVPTDIETVVSEEKDEMGDSLWSFSAIRSALTDHEGKDLGVEESEEDVPGLFGFSIYHKTPSPAQQFQGLDPLEESEEYSNYPKSIKQCEFAPGVSYSEPKRTVSDIHHRTNLRTTAAPWSPNVPNKKCSMGSQITSSTSAIKPPRGENHSSNSVANCTQNFIAGASHSRYSTNTLPHAAIPGLVCYVPCYFNPYPTLPTYSTYYPQYNPGFALQSLPVHPPVRAPNEKPVMPTETSNEDYVQKLITSFEEAGMDQSRLSGKITTLAHFQSGSRYLQSQLVKCNPEFISFIIKEIQDHMLEIMTDSFGNYFCQKLFVSCSAEQRLLLLSKIRPNIYSLCKDKQGTHTVQMIVELSLSKAEEAMICLAIQGHVAELASDLQGTHVIQKLLLNSEINKEIIVNELIHSFVDTACNANGLCVIKKLLALCGREKYAKYQANILDKIVSRGIELSQNPYGNYAVQIALEKYPHVLCVDTCLLYTSPSPRDLSTSRMPSSA
eukprot:TRINITY_DN57736_c0_g1_i1.p1 TRINITY_DN57736_c0_g1~~TRINITY_DN57736_c0_g1_i1.p1  ORF type:complete len:500 (-),score=52.74 TRINITY_DN57736_c0_g1_i1:142-1641(-)